MEFACFYYSTFSHKIIINFFRVDMNAPVVIEGDHDGTLLRWDEMPKGIAYELQMAIIDGNEEPDWNTLSSTITGTSIIKKSLSMGVAHRFRIKCKYPHGWDTFSEPSDSYIPPSGNIKFLSPPVLHKKDGTSISVEWQAVDGAVGYILRYREEKCNEWTTAGSAIVANLVRKNGLKNDGTEYVFAVQPIVEGVEWGFSRGSVPLRATRMSTAKVRPTTCGYTTVQGRLDWLKAHGITNSEAVKKISSSLFADPDLDAPLYYWQLFSILGQGNIVNIVSNFYERVYADNEERWFKKAFSDISDMDHHVQTQAAFWIDAFGGGKYYHGADGRLNYHHHYNAEAVMNAKGATRWMHHMRLAVLDMKPTYDAIDKRITPCIVDFLRTKMLKYADVHGWKFDNKDFEGLPTK